MPKVQLETYQIVLWTQASTEQVDLCRHIQCRERKPQNCPPCSWQAWTLWRCWTHRPAGTEGRYFHIPVAWTSSKQSFHLPTEHRRGSLILWYWDVVKHDIFEIVQGSTLYSLLFQKNMFYFFKPKGHEGKVYQTMRIYFKMNQKQ